jgi:hypothetical protein
VRQDERSVDDEEAVPVRLVCVKHPVTHLKTALDGFHRSGFEVLWQPDRDWALLAPAGTRSGAVVLEVHDIELELGAGGVYAVDDVDSFAAAQDDRNWVIEPCDGPWGRYAALSTRAGLAQRFVDLRACPDDVRGFFTP